MGNKYNNLSLIMDNGEYPLGYIANGRSGEMNAQAHA